VRCAASRSEDDAKGRPRRNPMVGPRAIRPELDYRKLAYFYNHSGMLEVYLTMPHKYGGWTIMMGNVKLTTNDPRPIMMPNVVITHMTCGTRK